MHKTSKANTSKLSGRSNVTLDRLQIHFLNIYFSFVLLGLVTVPLIVNNQQTPCCYKPPVSNCNCKCNVNQDLPGLRVLLDWPQQYLRPRWCRKMFRGKDGGSHCTNQQSFFLSGLFPPYQGLQNQQVQSTTKIWVNMNFKVFFLWF